MLLDPRRTCYCSGGRPTSWVCLAFEMLIRRGMSRYCWPAEPCGWSGESLPSLSVRWPRPPWLTSRCAASVRSVRSILPSDCGACRHSALRLNTLSTAPILVLYLELLDFSARQIGLFLSLTLLGDVLVSLVVAWIADRIGRRKMLALGSAAMAGSGVRPSSLSVTSKD